MIIESIRKFLQRMTAAICCTASMFCSCAVAGGGPLGLDHKLTYDNDGPISRGVQLLVEDMTLVTIVGGALWEGATAAWARPPGRRSMRRRSGSPARPS